MKLKNQNVVITGGNSGIGFATAKLFIQEGAKVAIVGRDKKTIDGALAELGANAVGIQADIGRPADIDRVVSEVRSKLGKVDVLFANAGIAEFAPFETINEAFFDKTFDINVKGTFFTIQKLLPLFNSQARILVNTSVVDGKGMPNTSVYAPTKAALRSLVRVLAAELAPKQIRVNAVAPGPIETPIYGRLGLPADAVSAMAEGIVAAVPLKRFGQSDEIAKAALFLASADSSYVTGIELTVDGGMGQV